MTGARFVAGALLAMGLGLGAIADRVPDHAPVRRDGRFVIAADLHVHSFLGDGAIAPWNLGREARRRGLDAIAITNHNQVFASRLGRWLSQHFGGAIILSGEEVTHPGHHVIALGIQRLVDWRGTAADAVDAIHAQGGVAIAAHPERAYWRSFDSQTLRRLDGAERLHPLIFHRPGGRAQLATFATRAASERDRPLAAIGSSDFHTMAVLGECRTFVFAREVSEAGILEAIRAGQTAAFADGDPVPQGLSVPPRPTLGPGGVLGWLGLLGLLIAKRCPTPILAGARNAASK
jgi:predicted metal-dependent phosphoesterase TrpH